MLTINHCSLSYHQTQLAKPRENRLWNGQLNPAEAMRTIVPLLCAAPRILLMLVSQTDQNDVTTLAYNMRPVICLAFTEHHMPTSMT
jgi:hypothetical protein